MDSDGSVEETYSQEAAFWSGIYPQDWVIDTEGRVAYANNGYEPEAVIAIIETELYGD